MLLEVSDSQKWSQCGARLTTDETHVDFVEIPTFDWNQVEEIQGLTNAAFNFRFQGSCLLFSIKFI